MNKTILTMAITVCVAFASLNTYAQVDKKSEKARKDVKEADKDVRKAHDNLDEAKRDLIIANYDSTADNIAFKKEAEANIAENKQTIVELRSKKWNSNSKSKEKYDKQIGILERRNNKLQNDIDAANNHTDSSTWESFKREFKHDMNELGKALKDIGINNIK